MRKSSRSIEELKRSGLFLEKDLGQEDINWRV